MRLRAEALRWKLEPAAAVIGIAYKDKPEDTDAFLRQYGKLFSQIAVDFDGRALCAGAGGA